MSRLSNIYTVWHFTYKLISNHFVNKKKKKKKKQTTNIVWNLAPIKLLYSFKSFREMDIPSRQAILSKLFASYL